MGDILSPKQLSNRMKAKGLQKLKYYCESCKKQCRDQNGFKCHTMSEGHLRQMEIFGQNPDEFVRGYSLEFETAFLEVLKRCHGSRTRVAATVVYNEYITNKHHVHMNATCWTSLTEFVMHLGKSGKCKVEDTERGWFITYNAGMDSQELLQKRCMDQRSRSKLVEEKNQEKHIEKQIKRAFSSSISSGTAVEVGEKKKNTGTKIAFAVTAGNSSSSDVVKQRKEENYSSKLSVFEEEEEEEAKKVVKKKRALTTNNACVLEELMMEEEASKDRTPYWLCQGIIVKVKNKALGEKGYHNKKGVVKKVLDKWYGEIMLLDTGSSDDDHRPLLRLHHQDDLETVIPCIGGAVRIVNGPYRGFNARLLAVDTGNFCAKVQLLDTGCAYQGRVLPEMAYDDICKLKC